jgi:glyoxylase-like metal-dependent hydrolase (beta-lactamase superfamily II)
MPTPLADDVWWYDLTGTNAYLVDDSGTATLVDAGLPVHGTRIVAGLSDAGFEMRDLDRILLTHYDVDHVGGLSAFDAVDLTIYAGAADTPLTTGKRAPPLSNHKGLLQRMSRPFATPPANPVEPVGAGDTVGTFTVYETPGHTPGHVCYVSSSLSTAFLGDLVRESDGTLRASPWLVSYDTDEVSRSIRSLADSAVTFETAAIGHGVPFSRGGSDRLADLSATL